tara:strand:+ start:1204 stop:1404 length:201 start_codon:yes stop_codon:yes gene_type:complete
MPQTPRRTLRAITASRTPAGSLSISPLWINHQKSRSFLTSSSVAFLAPWHFRRTVIGDWPRIAAAP